jgi:hypothetical protein
MQIMQNNLIFTVNTKKSILMVEEQMWPMWVMDQLIFVYSWLSLSRTGNTHVLKGKFDIVNVNNDFLHLGTKTFIWDNRNFDSSGFDSTRVKLYIISQSVKLISDNIWIGLVLWHRLDVYNKKLSIHNKCAWVGIHQSCCIVIKLHPSWHIFLCAILFIYNKWCVFIIQ